MGFAYSLKNAVQKSGPTVFCISDFIIRTGKRYGSKVANFLSLHCITGAHEANFNALEDYQTEDVLT